MKTDPIAQLRSRRKRLLTGQYMLAVSLIFLVSLSSLLVLRKQLHKQEGYAAVINMSGRQRMLSQHIVLLTHEILEHQQGEQREALLRDTLDAAVQLMQQSHTYLISGKIEGGGVELSDAITSLYLQPPLDVDSLVCEFIRDVKLIAEGLHPEIGDAKFDALSNTARNVLLPALNTVVQQYELESNQYSESLSRSALIFFLIMSVLLTVIVVFGFRPMANVVVENETMLHSILDSLPILMDIVSTDGIILYQSTFLRDHLGKDTVGQKFIESYGVEGNQCDSCLLGTQRKGAVLETIHCSNWFRAGTVVEISQLPILFKGQEAFLHSFMDITDQKKTEEFLIRAKQEADQASELKSSFLANMSHEIRTPMNAILGFSDLVLETDLTVQQQDYLKKINYSSRLLLGIINDILDYSKVEAGKLDLETKPFCLKDVFADLQILFADKAREKGIGLLISLDDNVPDMLIGDALRLQQILVNLVTNSLKFTDHGDISIRAGLEVPATEGVTEEVTLKFWVTDSGIGIAESKLATLFDSFSQADSSISRKYGGTGLGLAISKQLVELLGGTIEVSSTEGGNTVFSFTVVFRLMKDEEQEQFWVQGYQDRHYPTRDADNVMTKLEANAAIRGASILLVEDNSINRQLAEEVLGKAGVIVDSVTNGLEVLEKIRETDVNYDAILMDIQMPLMDGIECTRELRKIEESNDYKSLAPGLLRMPIIAMTANAMYGDREKCLQAGMDDYVSKPINKAELFTVLARWVSEGTIDSRGEQKQLGRQNGKSRRERDPNEIERKNGLAVRRGGESDSDSDVDLLPESLVGIDREQGLVSVEGDVDFYLRLLKQFVTEFSTAAEDIQIALDAKDNVTAERLAHSIKGMSGSLGMKDLAKAARHLEGGIKTKGQIAEHMVRFQSCFEEVLAGLTTLSGVAEKAGKPKGEAQSFDDGKSSKLLKELESMLCGNDFQAGSKWQVLYPMLMNEPKQQLQEIGNLIDDFKYEQALVGVQQIISQRSRT